MSAFRNLNALNTSSMKNKTDDDNSRIIKLKNNNTYTNIK